MTAAVMDSPARRAYFAFAVVWVVSSAASDLCSLTSPHADSVDTAVAVWLSHLVRSLTRLKDDEVLIDVVAGLSTRPKTQYPAMSTLNRPQPCCRRASI